MNKPSAVVVRVLGRRGTYPAYPVISSNHVLMVEDDFIWSAVRQPPIRYQEWGTEVNWLYPEEIRFFSSLSLVEPFPYSHGFLFAEPWTSSVSIPDTGEALDSDYYLAVCRATALHQRQETLSTEYILPQPNSSIDTRERGSADGIFEILGNIDPMDDLLLRGLSKFQASAYLIRLAPFMEEAAVAAFVSREAAFLIIKAHLEETTGKRAKLDDVLTHIREVFPTGEPFADVLESDYEARLMLVHPVSEFGVHWSPPIFAEECYDAVKTLIHLYRYILLGDVWTPTEHEQ